MKNVIVLLLVLKVSSFFAQHTDHSTQRNSIENMLNHWHLAAAEADYDGYFGCFSENAIYIGTDPTENWNLAAFKAFSKPFFESGKAWHFVALDRNIYLSADGKFAWFDELMDTQMLLCRGSGVLILEGKDWKIKHYVLSIAVPNEHTKEVVATKKLFDQSLIRDLKRKNLVEK